MMRGRKRGCVCDELEEWGATSREAAGKGLLLYLMRTTLQTPLSPEAWNSIYLSLPPMSRGAGGASVSTERWVRG